MVPEDCKKNINEIKKIFESLQCCCFENSVQVWLNDLGRVIDALACFLNDVENCFNDKHRKNVDEDKSPLRAFASKLIIEISNIISSEVLNVLRKIRAKCENGSFSESSIGRYSYVIDSFQEMRIIQKINAFNTLKHLKGHNKTLVVIGPNGSGKTSFANHLKSIDDHIKVIPALKPLRISGHVDQNSLNINKVNAFLYGEDVLSENILQQMVVAICKQHDDVARRYREDPNIKDQSIFEKIKSVFEGFFNIELDSSRFADRQMMAKKFQGKPFPFNDMSDGERAAFFYIATVMTAPECSFIIVDEPENHLNPAIYNKIWDMLISERNDCQFIFISHAVDFIRARTNCELIKINKYIRPSNFDFKFLGESYKELPMKNIVEIVGSRRPILFCEGDKGSYDYKVYEILFGKKFTVIPAGTCEEVKASVINCNKYSSEYDFNRAVGIVDYDLRDDKEIEKLKCEKVYTLRCNEIEMLLLDEEIFKKVLSRVYKEVEDEFEEFKVKFFSKIKDRKSFIVKRFVKNRIEERFHRFIIDDKKGEAKEELSEQMYNLIKGIDVCDIWDGCEKQIDQILMSNDYQMALKYCCLQHNEILKGEANSFVHDYSRMALCALKNDYELAERVKKKYIPDIEKLICANDGCRA